MKNINDLLQENKDARDGLSVGGFSAQKIQPMADNDNQNIQPQDNAQQQNTYQPTTANHGAQEELQKKMHAIKQKEIETELKNKARQLAAGYINLKGIPVPADVLQHIALEEVKDKKSVCFYYAQHKLARIATTKNESQQIQDLKKEYEEKFRLPVEIFITSQESFESVLKQYEAVPKIKPAPRGVEISQADLEKFSGRLTSLESVDNLIQEVSITELVAVIVAAGLKTQASDIHIETEVDGVKLRYRIDGVLHTATVLAKDKWQQLISRLKLLSNLKLNVADKPQDGRFSIFLKDDKVDVRVSMLPTAYGESVVMRLLLSKSTKLSMQDLGLEGKAYEILSHQIKRPNGMIITTGPTGSGKTTTLYAILNTLNQPETKIITIEDPIEYELKGVNQSQVEPNKNYTFAKGLRSIVRQDPDIVMVGEMRDLETVDIALNAALTGHLVLSTLHTNNAAGAIPRFLAMGAKPYLLAPALNLIMAQRLVRKLCEKCKQEIKLDEAIINKLKRILEENSHQIVGDIGQIKFYRPVGCDACNGLGYKGRVGIFEMFEMTKEIEEIILSDQISEYKIREIAIKNGMITMAQDGISKAIKGVTSVEEVFRVVE